MLELSPEDYPATEEEALAFDERLEQGLVIMLRGSGECSYEESNQWYLDETARRSKLQQQEDKES